MRERQAALARAGQREARDAEHGALLLHTGGIGEHRAGAGLQRQELDVVERARDDRAGAASRAQLPIGSSAAHADRQADDHRLAARERGQRVGQPRAVLDEALAPVAG